MRKKHVNKHDIKRKLYKDRELPERLRKKLIGELILNFDETFPIHLARIMQIDERISRIVAEIVLLGEDLRDLPEHIRKAIIQAIFENEEGMRKLEKLSVKGSRMLEEWLDVALKLAESRLKRIVEALKIMESSEV